MNPDCQPINLNAARLSRISVPARPRIDARDEDDEVLRELRHIWPSAVDLAKRPGTLYRLHAILNG